MKLLNCKEILGIDHFIDEKVAGRVCYEQHTHSELGLKAQDKFREMNIHGEMAARALKAQTGLFSELHLPLTSERCLMKSRDENDE
jgi:hypothetical protein